jgi:hypothetical protein
MRVDVYERIGTVDASGLFAKTLHNTGFRQVTLPKTILLDVFLVCGSTQRHDMDGLGQTGGGPR